MADGSDETNKGSSRPNPNDWAAINSVTDMPKIQARHRSQPEFRVPQSAPEPLATIDLKPRRHRSYSGFVALLVLCVFGGGTWYLLTQTDLVGNQARPEIPFSAPTLQRAGQAPDVKTSAQQPAQKALNITSQPEGARVIINGLVVAGKTPVSATVPAKGSLDVRLLLDGHAPAHVRVSEPIEPIQVELKPAKVPTTELEIITQPQGALVVIDGVEYGQTPAKLTAVPAVGPSSIRLRLQGHKDHMVLTDLVEGRSKRIGVQLTPAASAGALSAVRLRIESSVEGTSISRLKAGGSASFAGKAGRSPLLMSADRNTALHVRATATGHGMQERRIHIAPADYTVQFTMVPVKVGEGTLTLKGPKGLTVYLDSEELDGLPLKKKTLREGKHALVVVDEKSRDRIKTSIEVKADIHHELTIKRSADGLQLVDKSKP